MEVEVSFRMVLLLVGVVRTHDCREGKTDKGEGQHVSLGVSIKIKNKAKNKAKNETKKENQTKNKGKKDWQQR